MLNELFFSLFFFDLYQFLFVYVLVRLDNDYILYNERDVIIKVIFKLRFWDLRIYFIFSAYFFCILRMFNHFWES